MQEENSLLDPNSKVDLAILQVKSVAAKCKILPGDEPVTLRGSRIDIPGQIVTVVPNKIWQHKTTKYMSGKVISSRIDVPSLGLTPLKLNPVGEWNPADEYWGEGESEFEKYFEPIKNAGPRPSFEMEVVGLDLESADVDSDPIVIASELHQGGDKAAAMTILNEMLAKDLRCLDAHAHLGNWNFPDDDSKFSEITLSIAKQHYEIGFGIGELSFGLRFSGLLPWGFVAYVPMLVSIG